MCLDVIIIRSFNIARNAQETDYEPQEDWKEIKYLKMAKNYRYN